MERKDVILKMIETANKVYQMKADTRYSPAMKRLALKVFRHELTDLEKTLKEGEEK